MKSASTMRLLQAVCLLSLTALTVAGGGAAGPEGTLAADPAASPTRAEAQAQAQARTQIDKVVALYFQ